MIEAGAKVTASLARAKAPLGPAADRARAEALKLVRLPGARTALTEAPEQVEAVRSLLQQAGLAA